MKTVLAFTLSLLLETATATPIVTRLPDNPNKILGTCKDLRASASAGVVDGDGGGHPGACGYTQVKFYFDGREFEDYVTAVAEKTIEPFQITTYQGENGMKCARAKGINVELSSTAEVSYLNWLHNKPAGSKCANEWDRLKKVITEHETKHVDDVRPVINSAEARFKAALITNCIASGDPVDGILEKGISALKDIAILMKKDWDQHAGDLDRAGDLCDINCCACNDNTCYAGTFSAATNSSAPVSYSGAKGVHIELALDREDRDGQGRVIQQFYTLERGEFVYPKIVSVGEFDCVLNQTNFPLMASKADLTIFLNNPNYEKNSYHMGFVIDGTPIGTCHLKSNPKVTMTMPLYPFNFGFLSECSNYKTEPMKTPDVLAGSFANSCAGAITTVDWNFKVNN